MLLVYSVRHEAAYFRAGITLSALCVQPVPGAVQEVRPSALLQPGL